MNIKKVLLSANCYLELVRMGSTETPSYRYCIWWDEVDGSECVKRIRRYYIGTTAANGVASENNPNGWQAVEVGMK
jgi:hypothetical protein